MWVWDSSQQVLATQGAVYVQGHCLQEQRLYKRLHCLQALGPLQEHTTFRESLVCYTSPPGGVYVLGVLPVCSSSDLSDAVGGLALLCRGRVALLKVPGQTVQIHKPAAPGIHIPDFAGLAKPPDIVG